MGLAEQRPGNFSELYIVPRKGETKVDSWLLIAVASLLALSLLMVFSTTAITSKELFGTSTNYIIRHSAHVFIGVIGLIVVMQISPERLQRSSGLLILLSVVMLSVVLIPGVGQAAGGARRWLAVGSIRFQPGEMVKLFSVLYFSAYVARHKHELQRFVSGAFMPFMITSLLALLLLLEPDFGSSVVILSIVFAQLLVGGSRIKHLALIGFGALISVMVLVAQSPYRMRRFTTFLDPFSSPNDSGYQLIQSLIAVGSGGFLGTGLGAGKQKLFYLPAAHTDFIFAVIAEELGLMGALAVVLLFLVIGWRGFLHAKRLAADAFKATLCVGVTLLVVLPAFLNMSVVTGMLPTKGMVLPLVGYGGTAMIVSLASVGILLRLSREEV